MGFLKRLFGKSDDMPTPEEEVETVVEASEEIVEQPMGNTEEAVEEVVE